MEIKPSLEEAPYESNDTGTKRRKVADARDTASTFQLKLEESAQSAVSNGDAHGLDKGNDCLSPKDSFSDEQRCLHKYLSAEMEKLCEVLQLPMIKQTVEAFLDYVMKNHHVNQDSVPILQAFQISLCWNAASILKKEIDKGDSLRLAKKVLNFQCTEEAAYSFYLKLLSLKKGFLQLSRNNSGSPPKNLVSASEGCGKKLPLGGNPLSGSFDLQNVKFEAGERSSSVEVLEEQIVEELGGDFVDKKIKKLQKKCDKYMYLLHQKHEKEILELREMKEKHKLQLEGEVRLELAVINLTYPEKLRADMLKSVDNEFKKKLQERENLMEADLKELQARHSAELEQNRKSIDDWMDRMMSCISSSGPGKEVPAATSDTGEENIDRIVQDDCRAGNVIPSVMLETAADDSVAADLCSETSFSSPANPVTDKVLVVEQESAVSFTSVEIPPGVPSTGGSEIGTASTLELNTSLAVERGDNEGNLVAADVQGDQIDQTRSGPREVASSPPLAAAERSSPTIPFSELPQEHHGHTKEDNLPISTAPLQTVESSLEHLDQARSRSGETVRPPLSIEAMHGGNIARCQIEGSNSLPPPSIEGTYAGRIASSQIEGGNSLATTYGASFQVVEGSAAHPHQAVSLNEETCMLSPSSEGPNHCDNHCDLVVENGTDCGPDVQVSGSTLASNQHAENRVRSWNQAPLLTEPIVGIPLHVHPLQIELETLRKDMDGAAKQFDGIKLLLKCQSEKEIKETVAQIRQKYEVKIKEVESAFLLKKTQLNSNCKLLFMNKILAQAFESMCLDIELQQMMK